MLRQTSLPTGLEFQETMSGPFTMGGGSTEGSTEGRLRLHATVTVADIAGFLGEPRPPATMRGELELPGTRERIPFTDGIFRLFPPSGPAPHTLMVYELGFDHDGERHHLMGFKNAGARPSVTRLWRDTTTLHTRIYRGSHSRGEVVGSGVLRLSALGLVRLALSMRTPRAASPGDAVRALGGYAWLFARTLARTYLRRTR